MIINYFWDMELASALMPSIHAVELSLRNGIHNALTRHYDDVYIPGVLEPGQLSQLAGSPTPISSVSGSPTAMRC